MLGIWPPCNSLVSGNLIINLLDTGAMLYNKGITDDAECPQAKSKCSPWMTLLSLGKRNSLLQHKSKKTGLTSSEINHIFLFCSDLPRRTIIILRSVSRFNHKLTINIKPEWQKDKRDVSAQADLFTSQLSPSCQSWARDTREVVSPCHDQKWEKGNNSKMNTVFFHSSFGLWFVCLHIYHKSVQSQAWNVRPPLHPFSLPHTIWLYMLHCHLSYHLKGSQMSSHFSPWSCQAGSPKLLVTNVSPQPLKSEGPRGFFFF